MKAVWKYVFGKPAGVHFVDMPEGAEILSAGVQDHWLVVWVLVPISIPSPRLPRRIDVRRTGEHFDLPPGSRFIGSVTFGPDLYPPRPAWVVHVFDSGPEPIR